jgi:EAL domain-containing protein (putative c-di-GMP-specific phosphodiesterase class I)
MPSERVQQRIDSLLDQADRAMEEGRWQAAIEACAAALAFDPDNTDANSYIEAARRALSTVDPSAEKSSPPAPPPPSAPSAPPTSSRVDAAPRSSQGTSDFDQILAMRDESISNAKASGQVSDSTNELTGQSAEKEWRPGVGSPQINSFIHDALENDRFQLFRQPIVSVTDFTIAQYEILIRLATANGPVLSPGEFLPEAESLNLIQEIDQWVIAHATKKWNEQNSAGAAFHLAINLSDKTVGPDVAAFLRSHAEFNGVPPSMITIEINEATAIQQNSLAIEMAEVLHADGFKLAIDNFRSGATALEQLQNLNFEYLKLDGSLVRRLTENQMDREFVASVAELSGRMGAEVIGQFVQNGTTMEYLAQSKIGYGQGYYLGVPEPMPQ